MATLHKIFCLPGAILCAAASVPALAGIGENVISFRSEDTGAIGLMTEDGEIVAPAVFDGAGKFSHGICAMRLGNRYGYIGAEGLTLTAMNLRTARDFTSTPAGTPYASVRFDEGWNLIDARGVAVFPSARAAEITDAHTLGLAAFYLDSRELVRDEETSGESFRDYARKSVNNYLSFWYLKKEYETTQDWRARTTDEKLLLKVEELRNLAAARFVAERGDSAPVPADFKIVKYEADDSAFLLSHAKFGGVIVPVPRKEAALFRENFPRAKILAPEYGIGKNDRITLRGTDFVMPDGKVYRADADAAFCDADTCYAGFEVELPGGAEPIDIPPRVVLSDVDRGIPALAPQPKRARFVCILANETYEKSANVLFAGEDGYAFEKYCEKTLGVPRERILRSKNNSLGHMRRAVRDLAARAKVFPDAEIIFSTWENPSPTATATNTCCLRIAARRTACAAAIGSRIFTRNSARCAQSSSPFFSIPKSASRARRAKERAAAAGRSSSFPMPFPPEIPSCFAPRFRKNRRAGSRKIRTGCSRIFC